MAYRYERDSITLKELCNDAVKARDALMGIGAPVESIKVEHVYSNGDVVTATLTFDNKAVD